MSEHRPTSRPGANRDPEFAVVDKRPSYNDEGGPAGEDASPRYPSVVEQLKTRAEEAEARAREISAAYRRIDEERDAFRERLSRDLERRVDIARADMMRRIISVLDDLDRALLAARSAADPAALASGVALIRDRLFQALAAEGVEEIDVVGRPFDPGVAEAVATTPAEAPEQDGQVMEQLEKGYTLRGTLLRPARVKVARAAAASRD